MDYDYENEEEYIAPPAPEDIPEIRPVRMNTFLTRYNPRFGNFTSFRVLPWDECIASDRPAYVPPKGIERY